VQEELKLAMRHAKHKFKNAEKSLQDTKDKIQAKRDALEEKKGPRRFDKLVTKIRKHGKPVKWRRREIAWDFKRGEDILKIDIEKNINADSIDLFNKKIVRIGTILRLGNPESHGNRYYQVVSHNKKLSFSQVLVEKVQIRLDPDTVRKKYEARKEALKNWDDSHIQLDHEWIFETPDDDVQKIDEGFVHVMPRELYFKRKKFNVR